MKEESIFINRELSWLDFNQRVLVLGKDKNVPLAEQLKFLAIYGSNLDEFFMVRVGSLQERANLKGKKEKPENKTNMTPEEQLNAIMPKTAELQMDCDKYYHKALEALAEHGYRKVNFDKITKEEERFWKKYFQNELFPILSPQIVDNRHPFPFLRNEEIYLGVLLKDKKEGGMSLGIIPISSQMERLCFFKRDGETLFALTEELVYHYVSMVFAKESIVEKCLFRVTRNADIDVKEGMMDHDIDYREIMTELLKRRRKLAAVRLQVTPGPAPEIVKMLCARLELSHRRVFEQKSPLDLSFFYKLDSRIEKDGHAELFYSPARPMMPPLNYSLTEEVQKHDVLLYYPYQSIRPFILMLKKAARDPDVISIKMTLYRLARESQIVQALVDAAENGKEVVALVELRARFDEQNNIDWSERLEEAGCRIIYGFEDYKVHSKICLITRVDGGQTRYITQVGTGNYNEKTAELYTDVSLVTSSASIGADAAAFFSNMALADLEGSYSRLLVAPNSLKGPILKLMDEQIALGSRGRIFLKFNSLTDIDIIHKLCQASQAGVQVRMIVRGICCLLPGVPGYTDNVTVKSIVGRFLEHSRIYVFGQGENEKMYISSADLMTRNTVRRVEVACPIDSPQVRARLREILDLMWADTVKARLLRGDGCYDKLNRTDEPLCAQERLMELALERAQAAAQAEAAPAPVQESGWRHFLRRLLNQ